MICVADAPCDIGHAVWADRSPPIFGTRFACEDQGIIHAFHAMDGLELKKGVQYRVAVQCEKAEEPI